MRMVESKENVLVTKSFDFALSVIKAFKYLKEERREYILSKQLLRSGTSVGAMIRETQNAESKMDFVHKLAIAQKECDETIYWLELLNASEYLSQVQFDELSNSARELLKILRSAILSTKNNLNKQ